MDYVYTITNTKIHKYEQKHGAWCWSDGQCLQNGGTCLISACEGGHLDVVKYLCEVGSKELVMARNYVSGLDCKHQLLTFISFDPDLDCFVYRHCVKSKFVWSSDKDSSLGQE